MWGSLSRLYGTKWFLLFYFFFFILCTYAPPLFFLTRIPRTSREAENLLGKCWMSATHDSWCWKVQCHLVLAYTCGASGWKRSSDTLRKEGMSQMSSSSSSIVSAGAHYCCLHYFGCRHIYFFTVCMIQKYKWPLELVYRLVTYILSSSTRRLYQST